jgi:hypothetical protein
MGYQNPPTYDQKKFFEELVQRIDKPIEYSHLIARFLNNLAASQIIFVADIPYVNDPIRGKLLSCARTILTSAYYGLNQSSRYLRISGVTSAGPQGILMPRDGTITAMTAKSRSTGVWNFEVRRNGIPITLSGIPVVSSVGSDPLMDVDFNAGDFLQFYLNGSAVDHPIASVEVAWRA